MDVELLIVLAAGFFGLIFINIIALWNVSNRICDKIEKIGKDVAVMKELYVPHQTVRFQLNQSGLTGTIETKPDEFSDSTAAYTLILSKRIGFGVAQKALERMGYDKLVITISSGQVILFKIQSLDVDENASIIEAFINALDAEIYADKSKDIAESIEEKLRSSLSDGAP